MSDNKPLCSCDICANGKCGVCTPRSLAKGYERIPILKHALIETEYDCMSLNIIDWNRLNGYWNNPGEALRTIASWLINTSHYTIIETDLRKAPQRDDFPGWKHVGAHEEWGKHYWNWFHWNHPDGELIFSDSPDFHGSLGGKMHDPKSHWFYGDFGKVSASAFAHTEKHLGFGDIWISILSMEIQIIIEPFVSLRGIWGDMLGIGSE